MDQTRDLSGQKFFRLVQLFDAPTFAKEASVEDLCGQDLPPEVYADPVHRVYPCHTAAAVWASTAFYLDKKAELHNKTAQSIEERLEYYANYHGIPNAYKTLMSKAASLANKPEAMLSDEDYALVFKKEGETQRYYPLRNTEEVAKAAAYLYDHRTKLSYDLRREFADKVMHKSAQLSVKLSEDLTDYIERQAGYGACAASTAVELIRDRVKAAQKGPGAPSELQIEMLKLAELLEEHPSKLREAGRLVKLAQVIDDFDRVTGIYHNYGEHIRPAEDVLFELTNDKMASVAKDHCETVTGNIYKLAELEGLRLSEVQRYMGDDFADAVRMGNRVDSEKAAELIPTLDRELAGVFDQMMMSLGKYPTAKQASVPIGLSPEYMMELAEGYKASIAFKH